MLQFTNLSANMQTMDIVEYQFGKILVEYSQVCAIVGIVRYYKLSSGRLNLKNLSLVVVLLRDVSLELMKMQYLLAENIKIVEAYG